MSKKSKAKVVPLSKMQKDVLVRRWNQFVQLDAQTRDAHGVLNDAVLAIGGEGATLNMNGPEPVVTLP